MVSGRIDNQNLAVQVQEGIEAAVPHFSGHIYKLSHAHNNVKNRPAAPKKPRQQARLAVAPGAVAEVPGKVLREQIGTPAAQAGTTRTARAGRRRQ